MKKALPLILFALFLLGVMACDDSTKPNLPPIILVTANPVSGVAPLMVSFTAAAEDSDGIITAYSWNFGDGAGSSAQQNPTYIYNSHGSFTATCTVSDNGSPSLSASASIVITVFESKIPTLNSISPAWSVIHMPEFTLTVTGTDFFPQSKIVFDGTEMATTYISSTQIGCKIRPDDTILSSAVNSDGSVNLEADQYTGVLVRNPGTGGGDSASLNFTIKPDYTFSGSYMISTWSEVSHIRIFIEKYIYAHYTFEGYYLRCSKDKGATWGVERSMPDYYYAKSDNDIATDSSGAFYWIYTSGNAVYMVKSTNEGASWSNEIMIYAGTPYTGECQINAQNANIVSLAGGSMYATWMEYLGGEGACTDFDIWFSSSANSGNTWSTPVKLTNDWNAFYPLLSRNKSGVMHLFYYLSGPPEQPDGPRHNWSMDGGIHWMGGIDIYPDVYYSYIIPYVGHNNGLYLPVIQTVGSEQQVGVKISTDGGDAWSDFKKIKSLSLAQNISNVSFVEDTAGNINAFITTGSTDSNTAVWHQRSIDEGKTWSQVKRVSPGSYKTYQTAVDCDAAGNLYVLYHYNFRNYAVYFTSTERNQ
jgi:PKD repeat protein